ncbi:galactose-3-O-sulfotransferase 2 [Pygocentrus nattereri]|uniref:Galactose-3-O-sulfotransferase 4 n=1 Tax=Pygocentrus nattereri TaxID=42514 RepID=A0A3B4CJM6_PYGNA|nr:galactose-3-O-sulfotransferase 2 [Pygocentrus nattereri]
MTLRWLSTQLWRHRVMGLLLTLAVTVVLMLLATQSLQNTRGHNVRPLGERKQQKGHDHKYPPAGPGSAPRHMVSSAEGVKKRLLPTAESVNQAIKKRRKPPPVAFLKTHKTGSSTVQNLLFRLGEREKATFAFPYYTYQFSYPERFRAEFVDKLPEGSSQFDLLCSHMRLDLSQLRQVMPPNVVLVTILREPLRTFESVFSYYTSSVPAFSRAKQATTRPGNKDRTALSVFLEDPESFWDPKEPRDGLAKNPMSFDMGLNNEEWNASWPEDLSHLEEAFNLVMIAEHFDESLVLLGALLGLEPQDLAYVRMNARHSSDMTILDDDARAKLRSWNALDSLLYDFFLQEFWAKAEHFGLDRLKTGVAELRASTEKIRSKCVSRAAVHPSELEDLVRPWQTDTATVLGYEVKRNLSLEDQGFCVRLVLPELQYHSHLYFQQYGRDMRAMPADLHLA